MVATRTIVLGGALALIGQQSIAQTDSAVVFPAKLETKKVSGKELLKSADKDPNAFRIAETIGEAGQPTKTPTFYWPVGQTIRIAVSGGDAATQDLVRTVASEWFSYANLTVDYVGATAPAEVRLLLKVQPGASFSYLGTASLKAPTNGPTMQLSLPPTWPEAEKRRTILHEFGHMLGLIAENKNPNIGNHVNWDKLYAYASVHLKLSKEAVDDYFRPSPDTSYLYNRKPFDPASIMMHSLPPEMFVGLNGLPAKPPTGLSIGDRQFIAQIYPKESAALATFQQAMNTLGNEQAKALSVPFEKAKAAEVEIQKQALEDSLTSRQQPAPSTAPERIDERLKSASERRTEIVAAYMKLPEAERDAAAAQYVKLYQDARKLHDLESRNKAVYGRGDQYAPETYRRIYERSASVCYLSDGVDRLGTCFMIGKDLVLTCNHTLKRGSGGTDYYDKSALKVRFDRGANAFEEEAFPVSDVVFKGTASQIDGVPMDALDFALLEVGPGEKNKLLPSQMNIQPLPIDKDGKKGRDAAVYVIGYPGTGTKTVADNARVFLSFDNPENAQGEYELEARLEAQRLLDEANDRNKDADEDAKEVAVMLATQQGKQLVKSFRSSFRRGASVPLRWYLISGLVGFPPHPAFALDSDTFHGNSGSPVLSRSSSEVTGVLFRGMDDLKVGMVVSYLQHEEAIPIHVILQNWKDEKPEQLAKYGVVF